MASSSVQWSQIFKSLGLGKNTTAQLQAFRKRSDDAKRLATSLKSQKTDVDFQHYRSVLKNQDVVKQAEKIISDFKPVSYDVSAQMKAIDAFESKASEQAKATEQKIQTELKDLRATLDNIQSARPFEQLTVDDVLAAKPEIRKTVEEMVKKGKWSTPGYEEKFGNLSVI
ncbi:putative ATP synthase D chain, mitochondrial [Jaminaea rosea]|uniref:ATP synthase subunit d, mitochondrial n=1 Tax=Jaminaea rosea TaxID=1569628 RepID=A0A316US66_9BASI|nr:putative ATP synthase D chain, mitochondrial [Jaminaea rosea]PWN27618.1 putative ATP synthase D chain, mitochondrial [Jaminaea rosea]